MKKRNILLAAVTAGIAVSACNQASFKKTPGGIEYKIMDSHNGTKPKIGDYLKVQVITTVGDTTLMDTHTLGGPQRVELQKPMQKFDVMEGLALLSEGDSAVFRIPVDSMGIPEMSRPKYMKKGDKLQIAIKLLSVQNLQQMQEDMKKEHDEQLAKDDKEIKDFLAKNNFQSDKTTEGVYIVTHQEGTGITPQEGSQVKINYTGKSLDGKPFDSNIDTAAQIMHHDLKPMEFTVGEGQVLKGMDDALLQMKKGTNATIYIPSGLAYGPKGQPPVIKPNEILAFDIQLLDVNDSTRLARIKQAAQDSVRRARTGK